MYYGNRVFSGGLDSLSLFSYGPGILNLACSFYGKAISKISDTNIYFTSGKILKCHKVEFAWINPSDPIMTKFKFSLLLPYVSYRDSKEKLLMYRPNLSCAIMFLSYFPEGFSWEFLVRVCRPVLQILTLFQTKKYHFPHPFSDPKVVTKRNITCLHKTEIMSSLVRLKLPQKKPFRIHVTLSFFLIPLELKRRTR